MTTLRWILGLIIALLGSGFVGLIMVSNGLRKSFGASENNPLVVALPLLALGLLFAALVWPANRVLLHVAAIAAAGLISFCVWQMVSESASVLWFALLYLAAWLVFYWQSSWAAGAPTASTL